MKNMSDAEKVIWLNKLERATLECDWAKIGRGKSANRRYVAARKKVLEMMLGRLATQAEMDDDTQHAPQPMSGIAA